MDGWAEEERKREKEEAQRQKVIEESRGRESYGPACVCRVCAACMWCVSESALGVVGVGRVEEGGECGLTSCHNVGRAGWGGLPHFSPSYCCCAEPAGCREPEFIYKSRERERERKRERQR